MASLLDWYREEVERMRGGSPGRPKKLIELRLVYPHIGLYPHQVEWLRANSNLKVGELLRAILDREIFSAKNLDSGGGAVLDSPQSVGEDET